MKNRHPSILSSLPSPFVAPSFHRSLPSCPHYRIPCFSCGSPTEIMLLRAPPAFHGETQNSFVSSPGSLAPGASFTASIPKLSRRNGIVAMAAKETNNRPLTGVVFEPFVEVKKELDLVPSVPQVSLARQKYADTCEAAINEQINVEYNVSYVYHAMYAYFDRDNVALKGLAK